MKIYTTGNNSTVFRIIRAIAAGAFWIGVWYLISVFVSTNTLLPSPSDTVKALFILAKEKDFYISCLMTVLRITAGFITGVIAGTFFGWVSYKSDNISTLITPLKSIIKATPVASFIILALVWLDKNRIPVFISMLIVIPIMWSSVESSLKSIDQRYFDVADVFKLSRFKRVKYIAFPLIKNNYTGALETCLGIAWKSGVAAEVLCLPKNSMGKELYNSKVYLETDKLFAWTLCIILISLLFETIIKRLLKYKKIGTENTNTVPAEGNKKV